jgi:hypothetical protein
MASDIAHQQNQKNENTCVGTEGITLEQGEGARRGRRLVAEYAEGHETGSKPERRQFRAMMAEAEKQFDVLAFWIRAGVDRVKATGITSTGNLIGRPHTIFRRDLVAELRIQGIMGRDRKETRRQSERRLKRQEEVLPKTTSGHPQIDAGNESSSGLSDAVT